MSRATLVSAAVTLAVMVGALVAGASQAPAIDTDVSGPIVLVPSERWAASVDPDLAARRVEALRGAIEALREETGSGWTARQDDLTGYLSELSGGGVVPSGAGDAAGAAAAVLDRWSETLFGVDPSQVVMTSQEGAGSFSSVRAEQRIGSVAVLDASIVVLVDGSSGEPRVTSVRGRLYPGVDVGVDPALDAHEATGQVLAAAGDATLQGEAELVIVPLPAGARLAWRVPTLVEDEDGASRVTVFFVDALDGGIVASRPGAIDHAYAGAHGHGRGAAAALALLVGGESGQPVQVTGTDPVGRTVTAIGLQLPSGEVVLSDTTVPSFDRATGDGAIETYDAAGGTEQLPGSIGRAQGGTVGDAELIAAHAFSRYVYDFYASVFGRNSWDGKGGRLVSTVNFGDSSFCNAFFSSSLNPPQMVYGNPCAPEGETLMATMVDIDIAGHEITHGVTATSSNLLYTGQSGALNESFSDYLGNVIGNFYQRADDPQLAENACQGITEPTPMCPRHAGGGIAGRYLANGTTYADYVHLLDPAPLQYFAAGLDQDHGGVHLNSAIWNDATWAIRTRLAQIDQTSGLESPRARQFDQVMYTALTAYLTPTSGFLDARRAVEQAAMALQVDPVVIATIQEVFDLHLLCVGCTPAPPTPALPVAASTATQRSPVVAGDRTAWVEQLDAEVYGSPVLGGTGRSSAILPGTTTGVAWAGSTLLVWEVQPDGSGRIVGYPDGSGQGQVVAPSTGGDLATMAGSDAGAAWVGQELHFVRPDGSMVTAPEVDTPVQGGVTAIGAGGGTVAVGTSAGQVYVWKVGSDVVRLIDHRQGEAVVSVDVHGDRLVAIGAPGRTAHLYDLASGGSRQLSTSASPFGVTVSDRYVVWAEVVGELGGSISASLGGAPDTDLHLHSFGTGITYSLLSQRGQQGYPELSGDRLVWVDTVNGSDDIYTGVLPGGL